MSKANRRRSFSLRLQPYQGSLLAEVVDYLNAMDRSIAQQRLEALLVMGLLTQARLDDENRSPQERRRTCLEACDALEKHASFLRQLVGVPQPNWLTGADMKGAVMKGTVEEPAGERSSVKPRPERIGVKQKADSDPEPIEIQEPTERPAPAPPPTLIQGKASAAQMKALFGE